ncbi:uncharacterized protein LOC106176618 isoform X2 [Lingula anatina]|uniref:Uncharacterized protein LOC106176618 isoform X2 n=1 Tax=Lingula anatina TaxID=7574 RepID=A0A1S3JWX6_LINAN|nr:uncharacterized protein LOC106176618 isoform X2 [Lingula anatina]|eukprot:XP_013414539.1 uncharacterized protein LOC106176618 isoform X2 [Lingula anatina]
MPIVVEPPLVAYTNDNSTSLFGPCSTELSIGTLYPPLACGDNTRCVQNPLLFPFTTGSSQGCLCPLTSVPTVNGTCLDIEGSSCQTDQDCAFKTSDCVGLSNMGLPSALTDFLAYSSRLEHLKKTRDLR